ncbi:hypothetical protein GQ53DRAFT_471344 [Thozetella sp. PMI_491]|nr:hypothetical protein GQ53DRAFT_471344 [Thozetella sp. PMI_491]
MGSLGEVGGKSAARGPATGPCWLPGKAFLPPTLDKGCQMSSYLEIRCRLQITKRTARRSSRFVSQQGPQGPMLPGLQHWQRRVTWRGGRKTRGNVANQHCFLAIVAHPIPSTSSQLGAFSLVRLLRAGSNKLQLDPIPAKSPLGWPRLAGPADKPPLSGWATLGLPSR